MPYVHPDRYSLSKVVLRKLGVVVHTSESGDTSHDMLVALMARPGDRPFTHTDGTPGMYGSSYHAVARTDGTYTVMLGAEAGPFSAPPCNKDRWHICIPGRSAQTRDEWLEPISRAQIRSVAQFIVDKAKIDGFPLVRLTPQELPAGGRGYCAHRDVTYGFNIAGGHTDPGPNFPWDVLASDIATLTTPQPSQEDDMARIVRITDPAGNWVSPEQFTISGGTIEWITSGERRAALIAAGAARLDANNVPFKLRRSELRWFRLVGTLMPGSTFAESEFLA